MSLIEIDNIKQLMLDNYVVESMPGTKREFHKWEKDNGNPVITKKYDWEGEGPYAYNLAAYDAADDKYKMWYTTYSGYQSNIYNTGYAESGDGVGWKRNPRQLQCGSVVIDPRGKPGEFRFLSMSFLRKEGNLPGRAGFFKSKDGVDWEQFDGNPWWEGPSDVIDVMWDSKCECFVTYHKVWKITGKTLEGTLLKAYFPSFDTVDEGNGVLRIEGRELFPSLHDVSYRLINRNTGRDDGGGGIVNEDVAMLRVIGRAESRDFIHWTNHEIVLEPDEDDAKDVQYYGMPVFEYEGLYICMPRYFEGISGRMDVRFVFSRDGIHFDMPDKNLVLACGPKGGWDGGMVMATACPLKIGGRLCQYYGGSELDHTVSSKANKLATGRAWLRMDGFASLTGGMMITKPLILKGNALYVNAAGSLRIRLKDLNGNMAADAVWTGDSTCAEVAWQSGGLKQGPLRLEFDLKDGRLFSFWCE